MAAKKEDEAPKMKRVFVITPIGAAGSPEREHADFVLHGAIKPVFEEEGYEVVRADTMADPSMITDGIFNSIFDCEVCIADLSFGNVNVYYELGVRHAQSLPVIHIAENGTKLPFDNAPHNTIFFSRTNWLSFQELKSSMQAQLATLQKPGFKVSNPITHARGRIEVAKTGDDKDQMILDLLSRMENMERQFRRSIGTMNITDRTGRNFGGSSTIREVKGSRENLARIFRDNSGYLVDFASEIIDFLMMSENRGSAEISQEFFRRFGDILVDIPATERHRLFILVRSMNSRVPNLELLESMLEKIGRSSSDKA